MSTTTTNLGLIKPDSTDFYNIADQNNNMDKIDQAVGEKANKTDIPTIPSSLPNPNKLTIQANGASKGSYDGSTALTVNITKTDIGLGNVDNTADVNKSVKYATSAGNSDTVDNIHISVVTTLPTTTDANTLYLIKG
ncbi:hypothetical protein [Anaerosporobacter sp.]